MKALRFTAPGTARLVDVQRPVTTSSEVLVAPRYVGLCGTDLELLSGTMPYFTEGVAAYPLQPGHEVTGVVSGSLTPDFAVGARVLLDPVIGCDDCAACFSGFPTRCPRRGEIGVRCGLPGGACEAIAVPSRNLHLLPDGVSLRDAVFVEPGVTVLNAVERMGEAAGRRALVIGAGTLGLIAAQLLVSRGASVDVLVVDKQRAGLVERIAARPVTKPQAGKYELVIEAAGAAEAVRTAFAAVGAGGHVAVVGVQPGPVDDVRINDLVLKDATVHGVLNGPGLYGRMLDELAAGSFEPGLLIDSEFRLEDATEALERLALQARLRPKVMLRLCGPTPRPPDDRSGVPRR